MSSRAPLSVPSLADAPLPAQPHAVIGDVIALQVRQGDHHDLVGALLLLGGQPWLGERLSGSWAGDSSSALSTTRPVSAGKSGAAETGSASAASISRAPRRSAAPRRLGVSAVLIRSQRRAPVLAFSVAASKFSRCSSSLYSTLCQMRPGKVRISVLYCCTRLDVIPARHRDAVFGAFQLRLQGQEVLVGFQVRVALNHHHQPLQRGAELALRLLELLEFLRVVENALVHLNGTHLGARLGDLHQHSRAPGRRSPARY